MVKYDLAQVPPDVRRCFVVLTQKPPKGVMTEQEAVALITRLRSAEVQKTQCGRRLLNLYDNQNVQTPRPRGR